MTDDISSVFREASLRHKRLLEELAAAPMSDVSGVVDASGAGGGRSRGEKLWTLTFSFAAWRANGADVQTRPLTVRRQVTDEQLKSFQDLITPYEVIHIKARVVLESSFGSPQALLETLVGVVTSDAELNHHSSQLQQPVTLEDPTFGIFTLDRRVDQFTAEVVWEETRISLNLSESAQAEDALKTAHTLWEDRVGWNRRVRDYAVQELLSDKYDAWLSDDEAKLTPDEFKARMALDSITVYPDGSFDFWYDDGDLFWGHSIQIIGNLSKGPTSAGISG
jgi:hypothetical protein